MYQSLSNYNYLSIVVLIHRVTYRRSTVLVISTYIPNYYWRLRVRRSSRQALSFDPTTVLTRGVEDEYPGYVLTLVVVSQLVQEDVEAQTRDEQFFLKHVDDKGDHLLVDENLRITGIIDWQMERVVSRRGAFGPSLVTADMSSLCGGKVSLSADDVALAEPLRHNGIPKLPGNTVDEKVKRFFWGLALGPKLVIRLAVGECHTLGLWGRSGLDSVEGDGTEGVRDGRTPEGLVEHHSSS